MRQVTYVIRQPSIRVFARTFSALAASGLLLGMLALLPGCAKEQTWWRTLVNQCDVGADQKDSFYAPPKTSSLSIVADSTFSVDQLASLQIAVQKWNDVGQKLKGSDFFSVKTGDIPDDIRAENFQACQVSDAGNANLFYVVLEANAGHWRKSGLGDRIPGVTVRCYMNDDLVKQVVMVRPSLLKNPKTELVSVFVHELGHALGLDHSCSANKGTNAFRSCESLSDDPGHPYSIAVMYPTLLSEPSIPNSTAIKEDLQANDTDRAKCFYK